MKTEKSFCSLCRKHFQQLKNVTKSVELRKRLHWFMEIKSTRNTSSTTYTQTWYSCNITIKHKDGMKLNLLIPSLPVLVTTFPIVYTSRILFIHLKQWLPLLFFLIFFFIRTKDIRSWSYLSIYTIYKQVKTLTSPLKNNRSNKFSIKRSHQNYNK